MQQAAPDPEQLPPLKAIHAALLNTTETLARELANPTRAEPRWSDFEWHVAQAVCAMHGVSGLLAGRLRWHGPAEWTGFLRDQQAQTARRHERIQGVLAPLDACARASDLALVALKGTELHRIGLYEPGERPMADIDLLVRPADGERAARVIQGLGFSQTVRMPRHRVFVREAEKAPGSLGEHADNYLKIELHEHIREALPLRLADVTDLIWPRAPRAGLNAYSSKAALMIHLLLHAAGAMSLRAVRLLHLNDIARLSASMSDADWGEVIELGESGRQHWWALPPLRLTARYYTSVIPGRVLATLSNNCPWLLARVFRNRTLSDVSLSHLWIDAFPGIEWSQSLLESIQYAGRRVWPGKEMLELRRQFAKTELICSQSQWHHSSQAKRLLRWIVSRPPRAETLHTIRAALGHTQ